jgi:hypothetical protein
MIPRVSRKSLVLATMFSMALLIAPRAGATSFFFGAQLDGSQEVPPREVSGSGFGEVDVSDDLLSINVTLFVSGLSGNVASGTGIYGPAGYGQLGPLIFPLPVPFPSFTSGELQATFSLPDGVLAELMASELYFDVFTNAFSASSVHATVAGNGGEIRGQIVPETGPILTPEPATFVLLGAGLAAIAFGRWRRQKRS